MKAFCVFVLAAVVLAAAAIEFEPKVEIDEDVKERTRNAKRMLDNLDQAVRGAADDTDQAINWTWSNWLYGPSCSDFFRNSLVGLDESDTKDFFDQLSATLDDMSLQFDHNLSIGIGITYNGDVIYQKFFGRKNLSTDEAADEDTVVSIASNTKVMTSLMMHKLVDMQTVKYSDPVTKFYNKDYPPEFKVHNPYDALAGADAVTLESLASQSSGLPRQNPCSNFSVCGDDDVIGFLGSVPLWHQPLTSPHYSDIAYAILGHSLERALKQAGTEKKYEDFMHDEIFSKFEMNSTGFDYPDDIVARMAGAYLKQNGVWVLNEMYYGKSVGWFNPTFGAYSTTKDMLNYLKHLVNMDPEVLSPNAYEDFFSSGVDLADGVSGYSHGAWEMVYTNGFRAHSKLSSVVGFITNSALIRDLKLGVFSWTNLQTDQNLPAHINAVVMNGLVPIIVSKVEANQQPHEVPDKSDFVGSYNSVLTITAASKKGIYGGTFQGSSMEFVYDKQTTEAYISETQETNVYFFRYFAAENTVSPMMNSCLMRAFSGTYNGLVKFYQNDKGEWHAFVPDLNLDLPQKS